MRLNRDLQIPLFLDSHATPLGPGSVNSGLDAGSQRGKVDVLEYS